MAISLGDIEKRNKKQQQESFNYHWENQNGLWRRTSKSWNEQKKQEEEQELLRKQAEDRQGFLKSGNENGILGTLASGIDALASFGQGMSRTLEGQVDTLLYTAADNQKFGSKLAKDLFGENNFISNTYDFLASGFMDTAKHNSTADLFGTNGENSLFENLMWASGTAEKEAAKMSRKVLGNSNIITKGLELGSNARLNASQLREDGGNWRKTIDESSYLGDTSKQVAEGAGNIAMMAMEAAVGSQLLGMAGMTTINPMTGATELSTAGKTLLTFGNSFTSAYGNARSTAYENGADDITAHRTGFINGVAEGLSELMFDAMPGIKSPGFAEKIGIKDILTNRLSKALGKNVGKVFFKVTGGLEEGFEEMMSNAIVALGNDFMHMIDENYTYGMENQTGDLWEDFKNGLLSQESIDSFVSAGLTSILLGAGGTILNTAQTNQVINAYAKDNGMTFKEAKALFDSVATQTGVGSVQDQVAREGGYNNVVEQDEMTRNRIKNYMKASSGTNVEANLREYAIREAQEQGKTLTEVELNKRVQELRNLAVDEVNSPNKYTQFTQEAKNENDAELIKSLQDTNRNNTRKSHQLYEFADKIQSSREGVKVRFVNNEMIKKQGIKVDGTINGYNQNGVVYINVDGKNPYQQIAYHEIAHSIKDSSPQLYQQLSNLILQSANENDLEQYKKMYGVKEGYSSKLTEDYRDEYVNDKLGEKLNDGKFIDELTGNRNLLQKLIDKIKEMISYMTSGKEKKQMISLKNQLQEKYKQGFNEASFESKGKARLSLNDNEIIGNEKITKELQKYDSMEDFIFDSGISYDELAEAGLGGMGEIVEYYKNKNKPILKEYKIDNNSAALTEDRLERVMRESINEYKGGENYARVYVTTISPDQFLGLTIGDNSLARMQQEVGELDVDKLRNETQNIFLDVDMETGKVTGHEGRHRMIALKKAGIDNVEIVVYPDSGTYDRNNAPRLQSMNLIGQDFSVGKGKDTTIGEMIPVSKANQEELRNKDRSKAGVRYSLSQDSQGKELTKEQQEYFKDSKVRDDEGRLIPMYHGTPTGTTTEFRPGTYFTTIKEYADRYQNPGASSISSYSSKKIDNPRTYEVYLNIKNPFDTKNDAQARQIFYDEFYRQWGNGTDLMESGYPDWVDGVDLQEFLEQEHPEYDGFVIDEGAEGGYGQPVVSRGLSWVTMSPEQVKNIDNTNPTSNPDIRYSLSQDSQGRELSQEQQDYFKDSKVRDENGNLKVMYRGGNEEINVFDTNHKAKRYTMLGTEYETDTKGFYFSDNPEFAKQYGDVKEYYLNVTKPLTMDNVDDLNKIFKPMLDNMLNNQDIYQWQYDAAVNNNSIYRRFIDENGIDWETIDEGAFNESINLMKELGYDGFKVNEGDGESATFVFNSNQIKNVDNTNPTSNPDIRYSLTDERINNLLLNNSDVYDMVDSRTLSENGLSVNDLISRGLDDIDKLETAWREANYENSSKDFHEVPIEEAVSTIRNNNAFWRLSEGWFRGADSAYKPNMEKTIIMNPELRNAGINIAYQNYKEYIDKDISFDDFINKEIPLYRGSNDSGFVDADKFIAFSYRKDMVEKHFANRNKEVPISEIKVKIKDTLGSYQTTGEAEVLVPRNIVDENNVRYSLAQDTNLEEDLEKYVYPQVYENYKYEDKSKITKTIEELEEYKKTLDTDTDEGWENNFKANAQIRALEAGFDNEYDYYVDQEKTRLRADAERGVGMAARLIEEGRQNDQKNNQLQEDIANATPKQNKQFEIIQATNPAPNDQLVWIRSPLDIKTFEQVVNEEDGFGWGDYSLEDAKRDLKRNKVRVYSSYAIKNGTFVSTSYQQALDYAGGDASQVHSREVNPNNIAWISGDEGQYASENARYSLSQDNQGNELSEGQKEFFKDSKVVDDNGNLQVVYHGTANPGFTIFNPSNAETSSFGKYKFKDLDVNYFTASKDTAMGYTNIGVEENGNVYETYLNITNPYVVENSSTSDRKSWMNIKDNNIRQYETDYYNNFENKWNNSRGIIENIDEINQDLLPFNCELRKSGDYIELWDLGNNSLAGGETIMLYVGENDSASELFYEGIKEQIYGDNFEDYYYTSDDIAKWVLTQNANGQNYDGIIIPNILDNGPRGSMFGEPTTDYITFNSNQIKNVENTNPTSNPDIRYSLTEANYNSEELEAIKKQMPKFAGMTKEQLGKEYVYASDSYAEMTKLANDLQKEYKEFQKTPEFMDALQNYKFDSEVWKKGDNYADKIRYYNKEAQKYFAQREAINSLLMDSEQDTRSAKQIVRDAEKHFGITDDFKETAYITTNGKQLNFSGSHEGGQRGSRSLDHRQINEIDTDMDSFIGMGNIRVLPESGGINLAVEPNAKQYSMLRDYIEYAKQNGDEIYVDVDTENGTYDSARYNKNTPTSTIINDIKQYFTTGQFPQKSEYADFYYSLSKDTQQTANGLEGTARIESYEDYLRSLPSYKQLQQESSTNTSLPFEGNHGILTKEDYKNKKIEMFNKRIQQADNRMEKAAKKFARENMALNQETRAELDDLINEYKGMSREEIYNSDARQQIKDFVAKNSRQEFVEEVIDEDVRDLQKAIRNTTFTIDQSASGEFADGITQFKKNNPGIKIKYGRQDIDAKYQELAEQYPGMLEQDVTDKDIPFILADFMKKPYRRFNNTNVQVFELSPEEVDNIANRIYYGLTNNAISDEEVQSITKEISDKVQEKYGRQMAKAKYTEFARDLIEQIGLENIKDKKTGYGYKTNTMKRNLRDVINTKEKAQLFYDEVFKPVTIHNAQAEIDRQEYNNRILKYNINNDESVYIQMLGELKYNPETDLTTAQVEEFAQKHKVDKQKCTEAVEEFRNIYDELFDRISEAYRANGYKPLEYRKGYFPHFIEDKPTSILGKLAKGLGWNTQKGTLPTDLAGLTDMLEPGRAWTPFSQQRTGDATDYNALKGMDNYLRGAMDVIYHTEDIQRIRAIENEIRYEYSSKGIQDKIDAIRQDQDLSPEEQAQEIAALVDNQQNNPLGNFVTELRDYANGLANKKSILDRGMEQLGGREWYSRMQQINSRVSANMVGMNISSAITNFIPLTQGWSQISTKNMLRAMYESVQNIVRNDGFDLNSVYLTNRTQQAENLYNTRLDTINKKLGALFEGIDSFTSNTLVRGKYYENLDKGMSELQAIENADEFAKDVMAGRSKGDSPTIFNSKNPLIRLFTAFQLEVNNQYGYMFKDLPADMGGEAKDKLAMAFVKMFIGAWLYNWITEKITGRKAAFSPIDMAIDDYKTITNEDMDFASKVEAIATDTAQELPFVSGIMGGGRLPIQGAIPYENPLSMVLSTFEDAGKAFDADEEKRNTAINNLKKEWLKPVYFLALPFGGGQFKKMNEGMAMYDKNLPVPGSYTNAGKLRFEADTSPLGVLQSFVFGQYASQNARDYFENGYSPLSQKQINEALDVNLPIADYREINQGISNARALAKANKENQTAAMFDYINSLPLSDEQKNKLINSKQGNSSEVKDDNGYIKYTDGSKTYWYDAENDIVYNSKYKEVKKDINELTKYSNMKDVSNYEDYGSYEEFTYATNNPTKYNVIKQITDYEQYNIYKDEIAAIKENYKTTEGRKKAVAKYINGLNLNQYQKMMLYKMAGGYSIKSYSKQLEGYINGLDATAYDKYAIYDELFGTDYASKYTESTNLPPAPPTTNLPTAQPVQQTPSPTNLPTAAPPAPYYEPESVDEYRGLDGKTYYRDDTNNLLYDEFMNPVVDDRKYNDEFNEGLRSVKYKGNKKDLVKYYDDNNNVVWVDEETDEAYDTDYNLLPDEYYNEVQNIPNTQGSGLTRSKFNGDKSELRKFKDATGKVFYEDEETERIYDSNLNLIVDNNKLPILKPKKL